MDMWMNIRAPCAYTYTVSFITHGKPRDVATRPPEGRRGCGSGTSIAHRHASGQVQTQGSNGQVHTGPSKARAPGSQELQHPPNSQPHATFLREEFLCFWMGGAQIPKLGKSDIRELSRLCKSKCRAVPWQAERTQEHRYFLPRL